MILENIKDEYEIEINKIDAILNKVVEPIINSFKEDFLKDIVKNEHKRYTISRSSNENEIKEDIKELVSHVFYVLKKYFKTHYERYNDFNIDISIFYSKDDNSIYYCDYSLVILSKYMFKTFDELEGKESLVEWKEGVFDLNLYDENYHTLKNKDKVKTFTIK